MASILELDEHLAQEYKVFNHAPSVSLPAFFDNAPSSAYELSFLIRRTSVLFLRKDHLPNIFYDSRPDLLFLFLSAFSILQALKDETTLRCKLIKLCIGHLQRIW